MPPLLVTQALTHFASGKAIFTNIDLSVAQDSRVALIGPNGAGKSTLLRIFTKEIEPDNGTVTIRRDIKLGYVPQIESFAANSTVYSTLEDSVSQAGVSTAAISRWIGRSGFENKNQLADSLSGGWKKRLSLVSAFIKEPDLLLLDEPTNHLDIAGIEWLEEILESFNQTVIVVSHDRYFLERICTSVIELDTRYPQGVFAADGAYSDFIEKREEYFKAREQYRDSLANKVRKETAWLRAGVKARTTKSKYRQDQAYALTTELKNIQLDRQKIDISYAQSERKTKELIVVDKLAKSISGKFLFNNLSFKLFAGKRIGIVGLNGSGKTTLLKILLDEIPHDSGSIKKANNLKLTVFEQNRSALELNITLKEALCPHSDSVLFNGQLIHVIAWAKKFLFRPEQLQQTVGSLSGGEQARILIARAMCTAADVLVLDEPTNDLDISTLEMLEESLLEFKGAIILISHDRAFLDQVATEVIGFLGNGKIALFADYRQWDRARKEEKTLPQADINRYNAATSDIAALNNKLTKEERKELLQIEKQIEKLEKKILDQQLKLSEASVNRNFQAISQVNEVLQLDQKLLKDLYSKWELLEERRGQ